jgi:lipoprotein-anchoring transpeptidase ErfK/SrfK
MRMTWIAAAVMVVTVTACSRSETSKSGNPVADAAHKVVSKVSDTFDAVVPVSGKDDVDAAAIRKQRSDEKWRRLRSFQAQEAAKQQAAQQQQAQQQQAQQQQAAQQQQVAQDQAAQQQQAAQDLAAQKQSAAAQAIQFVPPKTRESFKNLDPAAIAQMPVRVPIKGDVEGPSVLKAQVYLDRSDFSVGALDGQWGKNSAVTTYWFQRANGLKPTGDVDEATFRALAAKGGNVPPLVDYTISAEDLKGPFVKLPESVYDKEKLDCLCYETVLEELAEKFHTTQDFLKRLNPSIQFAEAADGQKLIVPNIRAVVGEGQAPAIAKITVSVAGNSFTGFDANDNVVFHAPTTLGNKYDPSPNETVKIVAIARNPNFHYQPTLFHEVPDSDPEAHLKPGPNNPVGLVWMALSKPHFGIHGTENPESIGYASSHGCVRLTNWDALEVSNRVSKGVEVSFVDTRKDDM